MIGYSNPITAGHIGGRRQFAVTWRIRAPDPARPYVVLCHFNVRCLACRYPYHAACRSDYEAISLTLVHEAWHKTPLFQSPFFLELQICRTLFLCFLADLQFFSPQRQNQQTSSYTNVPHNPVLTVRFTPMVWITFCIKTGNSHLQAKYKQNLQHTWKSVLVVGQVVDFHGFLIAELGSVQLIESTIICGDDDTSTLTI